MLIAENIHHIKPVLQDNWHILLHAAEMKQQTGITGWSLATRIGAEDLDELPCKRGGGKARQETAYGCDCTAWKNEKLQTGQLSWEAGILWQHTDVSGGLESGCNCSHQSRSTKLSRTQNIVSSSGPLISRRMGNRVRVQHSHEDD